MREQLIQYVKLLFAGNPDADDMQQEILQNTLDRYDDLIEQGKAPEAAYRLAIAGIGDITELLDAPRTEITAESAPKETGSSKKHLQAIAIAMYICCVIPVIALANVGDGILGVCLMFVMIAAATALIIVSSGKSKKEAAAQEAPKSKLEKAISSVSGIVTLVIYLGISFWSGAWYITWLVFPISGAIDGLVKAIIDLKEAKKDEA